MKDDTINICTFADGRASGPGKAISQVLLGFKIMEQRQLPKGFHGVHSQGLYFGWCVRSLTHY